MPAKPETAKPETKTERNTRDPNQRTRSDDRAEGKGKWAPKK